MNLMEAFDAYPDIAKSIIIKQDAIRLGVTFSDRAQKKIGQRKDIAFKGFWLFSYDHGKPIMYGEKVPLGFYLDDGTEMGTIVQVRSPYKETPYKIDLMDDDTTYMLYCHSEPLTKVNFDPVAKFFSRVNDEGIPMASLVQTFGDLLFVTANKYCDYFARDKQCLFCDLTPHAVLQKKEGEAMILRKKASQIAEVLEVGLHERRFRHIFITGGSFLKEYQGKSEIEWYEELLNIIAKRLRVWFPTGFQVNASDDEGWRRLHDTGVPTIQPNIEVWDKRLFEIICPGKNERVGYDEWIKRTIRAVDFWGPGNVNPNFVQGVEMAEPFGFKTVEEAVKSTLEGHDFLMGHGVLPRQGNTWCIEQGSKLTGANPPPLEYYIELGKGYLELREKHGFITPPSSLCRYCCPISTEYDFEYFHGNGPSSKKAEEKSIKAGDKQ